MGAVGRIVTFTESVSSAPPASTVSMNVSVTSAVTFGAAKVSVGVVSPFRFTVGLPAVWIQE